MLEFDLLADSVVELLLQAAVGLLGGVESLSEQEDLLLLVLEERGLMWIVYSRVLGDEGSGLLELEVALVGKELFALHYLVLSQFKLLLQDNNLANPLT